MSFVGPRPWVKHYIDKLNEEEKIFLRIRPGITSPATLKYANEEYLLLDRENPEEYHDRHIFPDKIKFEEPLTDMGIPEQADERKIKDMPDTVN